MRRKPDKDRRYRKCRACGSTRVKTHVAPALEPGMELVIVECDPCETRRGTYYRKKSQQVEDTGGQEGERLQDGQPDGQMQI